MPELTTPQRLLYEYICARTRRGEPPPTLREICEKFHYRSKKAAADHLDALVRKGCIVRDSSPRGIRLAHRLEYGVPLLGSITAGWPECDNQPDLRRIPVEPEAFGIRSAEKAFALEVRGDSMTGRQLFDGDIVLCDAGTTARNQDIVAALIDNETSLKTLVIERGKTWLRAENPRYPDLIPVTALTVQGVARGVIRFLAA